MRRDAAALRKIRRLAGVVSATVFLGACGGGPIVRVADGRSLSGRSIRDETYAAFLLGALAEEAGDDASLRAALAEYEVVARDDAEDPEVWTRIARTRCRLRGDDPQVVQALSRAFRLVPDYPPARVAAALCASSRGARAAAATPDAVAASEDAAWPPGAARGTVMAGGERALEDQRRRLEGLTLLRGDRAAAWDALTEWATAHGDATLAARGMIRLARLVPERRFALGQAAIVLAGDGHLTAARALAAALMDLPGDRSSGGEAQAPASLPLVARLALDEAILARDAASVAHRSARAHLGLEVAAGRAWALGAPDFARTLIATTLRADPGNLAARMIRDGATSRLLGPHEPSTEVTPVTETIAPDVALPYARAILLGEGSSEARSVLAARGGLTLPAGDAVLTALLVELTIAGVIPEQRLPADARIELAVRRVERPDEKDVADPSVDARHRLLGLVLLRPADAGTAALETRLSAGSLEDPLVAVALAKLAVARHQPASASVRQVLEAAAPADPIVAATLVDVLAQDGSPAALAHARVRLAALAKTPGERARATR